MIDSSKEYAVGVDIGGTNTVFGLVDRRGRILERGVMPTGGHRRVEDYVAALSAAILAMISRNGATAAGIGIGAPCADGRSGSIEAATDLPWPSPIPLARLVEEATALPVMIGNDANAAAVGEMNYGAARGMKDFILITLGTGVGSGIVSGGHLIDGHRGFAGELGHVKAWRAEGRPCGCGRVDCLQTYCSAKGVTATARRLLDAGGNSCLRMIPSGRLSARDVAEAAHAGDALARETLRLTGETLGEACAQFAAFSDPEAIILFGGVTRAGTPLTNAVVEAFRSNALNLYRDHVKFLLSGLDESDAALLGASALGWQAASSLNLNR